MTTGTVERKIVPTHLRPKESLMVRRSAISVFALAVAFVLGMLLANRPATAIAQPPGGRGKCVGVSSVQTQSGRGSNGSNTRIIRAFEDGTIEEYDGGGVVGESGEWKKLGK